MAEFGKYVAGSLIGLLVLVALIAFGSMAAENHIERDCERFGAFSINGNVYECAKRAPRE